MKIIKTTENISDVLALLVEMKNEAMQLQSIPDISVRTYNYLQKLLVMISGLQAWIEELEVDKND